MEVLNSTPTLTCSLFGGNLEIFSSLNSKKVRKKMENRMVKMEPSSQALDNSPKTHHLRKKLEARRRRERKRSAGMKNELK